MERSELARVHNALNKEINPLSDEHFIRTCCQIMKINENKIVESLGTAAVWEGVATQKVRWLPLRSY
jgi:hypothetical protein